MKTYIHLIHFAQHVQLLFAPIAEFPLLKKETLFPNSAKRELAGSSAAPSGPMGRSQRVHHAAASAYPCARAQASPIRPLATQPQRRTRRFSPGAHAQTGPIDRSRCDYHRAPGVPPVRGTPAPQPAAPRPPNGHGHCCHARGIPFHPPATLFPCTTQVTNPRLHQLRLNHAGNLVHVGLDLFLVRPFGHDANQRLRP